MNPCLFAIVGQESIDNMRLSVILRRIYTDQNVFRYLEFSHLMSFLAAHTEFPIVVYIDLFSFKIEESTMTIGEIRDTYPKVVFNLYIDKDEYRNRQDYIPEQWCARFSHYYMTYKEADDVEYEPIVRSSAYPSQYEAEFNVGHTPIRLTPIFNKGIVALDNPKKRENRPESTFFISYSRSDWDTFVAGLVNRLAKVSRIWVDQSFIAGGDDWMDSVGEALRLCNTLILVLSPEALASRYVKMEYRYFFRNEKPIIPLLYQKIVEIPFELSTIQHIDFTGKDKEPSYSRLLETLNHLLLQMN